MILQIMPDQIPSYWDEIKEGLGRALPSGGPDRRDLILQGMLLGTIQMWIIYRKENDGYIVEGGTVTAVIDDVIHDTKNLLNYATWAIEGEEISKDSWFELLESLKNYARSKGCNRLVAFTEIQSIIRFASVTGGEAKYTFVTWDV